MRRVSVDGKPHMTPQQAAAAWSGLALWQGEINILAFLLDSRFTSHFADGCQGDGAPLLMSSKMRVHSGLYGGDTREGWGQGE